MATFKPVVLEHHLREDNTWNVKIRVTHERKSSYISTPHYVTKKQLTKDFKIKDPNLNDQLNMTIKKYRDILVKLGDGIALYNAKDLADYLEKTASRVDYKINFHSFSQGYINNLERKGKSGTARNLQTALNGLVDFFGGDQIFVTDINAKSLIKIEEYLRSPRKVKRTLSDQREITWNSKGLSDVSVSNFMTCVRTLFNAAREEYNDEDTNDIKIPHYPFKKYKIISPPETQKRNVSPEVIKQIRDTADVTTKTRSGKHNRANIARDVFMLSFYLVGMNTIDLYNIDEYSNGRLSYKRAKTSDRRKDNAFISIKVEPEAEALIEKYKDPSGKRVFSFYHDYSTYGTFNENINKGLKIIAKANQLDIDLTFYYARHSWATIARNKCRISKDDISLALNHSSDKHEITDVYIEKDWTIIDEANRKVLDTIKD